MTFRHILGTVLLARFGLAAESVPAGNAPGPGSAQDMDAVVVTATRYKDPLPKAPKFWFRLNLGPFRFPDFGGAGPFVLTAARRPQPPGHVASTAEIVFEADLHAQPSVTLEGALLTVPSFWLSSRSGSLVADGEGLALRGVGGRRGSRTLLLLDGGPLNDPFDGGIRWTKLPHEALARVEIVPGGGAAAWGNTALAGTLQLFTRPVRGKGMWVRLPPPPGSDRFAEGPMAWGTLGTLHGSVMAGDFGTRRIEFSGVHPVAPGLLQVLGRTFTTDGFMAVAREQRGPVDEPAWSRHRWLAARWRQPLGEDAEFAATARGFEESRGGGTAYTRSGSREKFGSVQVSSALGTNLTSHLLAYLADQSSAMRTSTVDARRATETPLVDQFAVPATTVGALWTATWRHPNYPNAPTTSAGGDIRVTRSETRENFNFSGGDFAGQRIAGGRQTLAGFFAIHDRQLTETWRATFGARLDAWRDNDGHRHERERISGVALRDERYADRNGLEFTPNAGLVWHPSRSWRWRASAQHGFRRPTLHELYRPEHDDGQSIEPNPHLPTERITSGEAGLEWSLVQWRETVPSSTQTGGARRAPPKPKAITVLSIGATAFTNEIRNFVGDVPLRPAAQGSSPYQRMALDRVRVHGAELSARWTPAARLAASAAFAYHDATVQHARLASGLIGKRLPQVPRRRGTIAVAWQAPYALTLVTRARWTERQFDDLENLRPLGRVTVVDLGVSRPAGKHVEVFLTVENVGDARVETGRSASGVVNIGTPRFALGGIRGSW